MSRKSASITEFCTNTTTLRGRGYTAASNGGLTETPATKDTFSASKQPITGFGDDQTIGKPVQDCDWWFGVVTKPTGVLNGDILVDSTGQYSIKYMELINSFMGSYFAMWCQEIRE